MLKEKIKVVWYWICVRVCRFFCIVFFRLRVYGRENIPCKGAFLLISNHQSFLDPLYCGSPLERQLYFLARSTLFTNWFFGWLISSVNTIPVKRGQADLAAMRKIISKLKEGWGVCLFPEATRTSDGKIAPFKSGFGLLARRSDAAILPVVIDGGFECWPRHQKIFWPGQVMVQYGKCLSVEEVKSMNDKELAENLTNTLRRMQNEIRIKRGKKPYKY